MIIPSRKWLLQKPPKRILAIRLQAMGDLVITLPYLQAVRNSLPPETTIDLLTREEVDPIPKAIKLFNKIYSIKGGRNFKLQCLYTLFLLPQILLQRYEVVLDLQNNLISRIVRKTVRPKAWSEFDKVSAVAAGERTRATIEAAGLGKISTCFRYVFKSRKNIEKLLQENGWDGKSDLIILNPAGAFPSRNWPLQNYVDFVQMWIQVYPRSHFIILGTKLIEAKALYIEESIKDRFINLVNKTSVEEAFLIIQSAKLVLSEDSGLMHMAWVSGVRTLALFGSTRSDWSRPLGDHSLLLSSSDLACGNCMLVECKFGTTHCLTRFTPEFVFKKALSLLEFSSEIEKG